MRTCHGKSTMTGLRHGGLIMLMSVHGRLRKVITMFRVFANRTAPPAPDLFFGSLTSQPASANVGSDVRDLGSPHQTDLAVLLDSSLDDTSSSLPSTPPLLMLPVNSGLWRHRLAR